MTEKAELCILLVFWHWLVTSTFEQEYHEDAIPYLEQAAKIFPEDDDIQKKLAACYKKTGKLGSHRLDMSSSLSSWG